MKLSLPIHQLKREARKLARTHSLALHAALDRMAVAEGYESWSLLAARYASASPAARLHGRLEEGELVLVGARPGQGKTMMALELAAEAVKAGRRSLFFTLEYTPRDMQERLARIGFDPQAFGDLFASDCSDAICADYIVERAGAAEWGTLIVIDYLQLLDQRRENAPLDAQVAALRAFAQARGLVIVFIAQIDRSYDPALKPCPELSDVRLPNRLDLSVFGQTCFLHDGQVRMGRAERGQAEAR